MVEELTTALAGLLKNNTRNVPQFNGQDTDLEDWLATFEALTTGTNDRTKVLWSCFVGRANEWLVHQTRFSEATTWTWDQWKEKLRESFGIPKPAYVAQLAARYQRPGERTIDYYYDVLKLCTQVNPKMGEEEKVAHLIF